MSLPIFCLSCCPGCSPKSRQVRKILTTGLKLRSDVRGKARSGEAGKPGGKPWLIFMSECSWSCRFKKWMYRYKTENRRDNSYTEVVIDSDTEETILECVDPLTEHQGHRAAEHEKTPVNPS